MRNNQDSVMKKENVWNNLLLVKKAKKKKSLSSMYCFYIMHCTFLRGALVILGGSKKRKKFMNLVTASDICFINKHFET